MNRTENIFDTRVPTRCKDDLFIDMKIRSIDVFDLFFSFSVSSHIMSYVFYYYYYFINNRSDNHIHIPTTAAAVPNGPNSLLA